MAEVIKMHPDLCTVSDVIEKGRDLQSILVIGYDENDNLFFGMSGLSIEQVIYLIEKCKHTVFTIEGK